MKKVISYMADDGTVFLDREACASYESAPGLDALIARQYGCILLQGRTPARPRAALSGSPLKEEEYD
jgi:hypothetical protein